MRCHEEPTPKEPHHVSCAPAAYDATLYWDGVDNLLFRPLSETVGIATSGESVNVNSLDEVPDSAWFTNRLGVRPLSLDELRLNACPQDKLLDSEHALDGAWLIDKGKTSGSTAGFCMNIPGKGKYLVKLEVRGPERQGAATVVGEAVYYAAGYNASCEQLLYVRPSTFKLAPGLIAAKGNFGDECPFDRKALDDLLAQSTTRGASCALRRRPGSQAIRSDSSATISGRPSAIGWWASNARRCDGATPLLKTIRARRRFRRPAQVPHRSTCWALRLTGDAGEARARRWRRRPSTPRSRPSESAPRIARARS